MDYFLRTQLKARVQIVNSMGFNYIRGLALVNTIRYGLKPFHHYSPPSVRSLMVPVRPVANRSTDYAGTPTDLPGWAGHQSS